MPNGLPVWVTLSLPVTAAAAHASDMRSDRPVPRYPGLPAIVDGSEAVAHVETRLSEVACVYPITPSTTMAALFQAAVADGRTNLWGTPLRSSSRSRSIRRHRPPKGAALAGGRVTNFTAGQGLVLMKEVLYVISGKRLPVVFHVGARALTSQALNIHAGHDDVMAVADTGWGIVFARNAQEAADLAAIARRVAEATDTPFIVAQDGFLTTHTLENVRLPEDELLRTFVGDPHDRIRDLFDPAEALMTGVVQNQDSYMKGRIGQRAYTDRFPAELAAAMAEWSAPDRPAVRRSTPTAARTRRRSSSRWGRSPTRRSPSSTTCGRRAGRSAASPSRASGRSPPPSSPRPSAARAPSAWWSGPTSPSPRRHPLTREIRSALYEAAAEGVMVPRVLSFSAGLGSRDVAAGDLVAVFDRLAQHGDPPSDARRPRDPSSARVGARAGRPATGRSLVAARPFDRRFRLGHDQQARRHARRRAVRQVRPGLPALWVREEGPADDVLPDDRRRAHPPPCRIGPRRVRPAPRRLRVRAWRPARRARRRWRPVHPVAP